MKTLRRWSGVIKRRLRSLCEIKRGIMLSQPLDGRSDVATDRANVVPDIRKTLAYRAGMPWTEKEFIHRIRCGHALYERFVDGQPVCYGWVAEPGTRIGVLHDLHLVVPDRGFYIWDCATGPAFRGQGYFRALLHYINHVAYPTAKLALVAVDTGNQPSRRALAQAGFRPTFSYASARFRKKTLGSVAFRNGKIVAAQAEFDRLGELVDRPAEGSVKDSGKGA